MSKKSLAEIANEMAGIDIAILSTHTENGEIANRPMSNNGDVKAAFQQHWTSDLDKWFDEGVDTPGIVLIKVKANRVTYWKGREEGEVELG
jgi:general stress protein 26